MLGRLAYQCRPHAFRVRLPTLCNLRVRLFSFVPLQLTPALQTNRYLPGHIHAFYLVYVYYDRRSMGAAGRLAAKDPPLVFSKNILQGGEKSESRPQARCESHRSGRCRECCGSNESNRLMQGEMDNQTVSTVQRT